MNILRIHTILADGDLAAAQMMARREAVREALLANRPRAQFKFRGRYYIVSAPTSGGLRFQTRAGADVSPQLERDLLLYLAGSGA